MTDGMGKAMSTELVLSENSSLSQAEIDQRFSSILGVTDYQIYTDPTATYIDHIDCWAKLLDVDKVLIRRVPSTHPQFNAIEQSVTQWQSQISSYGTPYRIFRVDTPNNEPYTNSFIMNGRIYVPQTGSVNDLPALAVYQSAMPGFLISGYSFNSYISTDALHCRVNTIFDSEMIAIRHQPLDLLTAHTEYTLTVEIDHHHPLDPISSFIAWSTSSSGPWQQSQLTPEGGGIYSTNTISPALNQELYYWIQAADSSGRVTKLPLCAGLDPFVVSITNPNPSLPAWSPVSYANPPATVHVQLSLFGSPAQEGDLLGAFVNGECRGTALISSDRNSEATIQVQLAQNGEVVSFSMFSTSDGTIYDSVQELNLNFGEILGEAEPLQIGFTLDKPQISISNSSSDILLSWSPISGADQYNIQASSRADGDFETIATTSASSYLFSPVSPMQFFRVIAIKAIETKN
ncbi:Porphyromonas-type peptidyl-arginine deiminase [anaerobic digester metagenome]